MDDTTIKANISRLRKKAAISQEEMADRIGLKRNAYRNIECGSTQILNAHLPQIAQILGTTTESLVFGYEPFGPDELQDLTEVRLTYNERVVTLRKEYESQLEELRKRIAALEEKLAGKEELLAAKDDIIAYQRSALKNAGQE